MIRHRAAGRAPIEGDVLPVLANDLRLGQVFLNLLLNAAQAIPPEYADVNEIRIATWHDESKGVVVSAIEDTGIGIAAEVRVRMFEPFFTTKPIGVGTGLGLSTCYGIVEGFGGSIEVESVPGKGSIFRVCLPAGRRAHEAEPGARASRSPCRSPTRSPSPREIRR